MDFGGRKELVRMLVGSHNYNLNTITSDKDYKVFIAPSFDDLYYNKQFSKSYIGEIEDFDCHDIRKVSNLWWKANVNFLEVLFSDNIITFKGTEETRSLKTMVLLDNIFAMKKDIVKMNIPYLYNACIGMHITKKKQIYNGTEGTKYLVDEFGYDTKQAMHSMRILDFLRRFMSSGFNDFKAAIWYESTDPFRKYLLDLKAGKFSIDKYLEDCELLFDEVEKECKSVYAATKVDNDTNEKLLNYIKEIIKVELF